MPRYDIALIVTIEADDYGAALRDADLMAAGLGDSEGLSVSTPMYYDHDNEGQRVLYLHPIRPEDS